MELAAAFLCNSAAQEESGLVYVLGAFVDRLQGPSFPIRGQVCLVARVRFDEGDFDQHHVIVVSVDRDDETEQIARIEGSTFTPRPPPEVFDPRAPIGTNLVIPLPLEFRRDGLHVVTLVVDGDTLWTGSLQVGVLLPNL